MLLMQSRRMKVDWRSNSYYFLQVDKDIALMNVHAFDSDVVEAPTAQTMFMANLSSADPVYDEDRVVYDSWTFYSEYTTMISIRMPFVNIMKEHEMHENDMLNSCPILSLNTRNMVVDNSLTGELETYKEQVELYERQASTFPKALNTRDNQAASTFLSHPTQNMPNTLLLLRKKQVTFEEQCAMSKSNTHKPVKQLNCQKTNVLVPPSTEVNNCTDASGSQPRSNIKKNRILAAKSVNMKKVENNLRDKFKYS
ncbi:hypothetical protein Tco_1344933 [Tanacetum coccineum]